MQLGFFDWRTLRPSPYVLGDPFFRQKVECTAMLRDVGQLDGVSTIFMGWEPGGHWFETIVFGGVDDDDGDEVQRRCATYDEAVAMHLKACVEFAGVDEETAKRSLTSVEAMREDLKRMFPML